MTLSASFVWKNPDSTRDLNNRLRGLVRRGILSIPSTPFSGDIAPAIGLTVQVRPLIGVSYDGMTVIESEFKTLSVLDGQKQYIVVRARYNEGGAPATPTLAWQVLSSAAYAADPEKDYLIVVGTVDLPLGALVVTQSNISYEERDEINQLGRDWYRGVVANPAGLPVPPPAMNVVGDFYFVQSDHTFHFWNGSIWEPLNTGSYNSETALMNKFVSDAEQNRFVNGSGVVAGSRPKNERDFASDLDIRLDFPFPNLAPNMGCRTFSALVNGHRVQVYGNKSHVTLDPKPGIGERYDIVFLEVWREAITVPETFAYKRNPDGSTTYTLQEVDDTIEALQWSATNNNYDLNPIEPYAHAWRVVKWRFGKQQNMPSTACLYNPSDPTISGACTNIDGNPFVSEPAGLGSDDRVWMAPSVTASDGYSWAIPLFVVKRTSIEAGPSYLQEFRDGVRYIFPVYPIVDVDHAARELLDTTHRSEPTPLSFDHYPFDEPSGFLSGMDFQIGTKLGSDNISVYEDQAHIRIRGIEDWITLSGGPQVALPVAPIAANDWARQLVYLRMNVTLYSNGAGSATSYQYVSQKHRPYIPSNIAGPVRGQGWKRGYVTFEYVVEDFGSTDYLDTNDAMVAAGWSRGDLTMVAKNAQYEDGGIWSRAIAVDADDRVHPYACEWAVPICLLHRRNQAAWAFDTNPNGSTGRPDTRTDPAWIYPDDLVDLRHQVGLDDRDLKSLAEYNVDAIMKGSLRTRLANKYAGAGTTGIVAGSRILQSDIIGAAAGAVPLSAPDGYRKIWSDAKEFVPHAITFALDSDSSGGMYEYDYHPVAAPTEGYLKIKSYLSGAATQYMQLVRQLPAVAYVGLTTGSNPYRYDFFGPPAWTTREGIYDQWSMATGKYIDSSNDHHNLYCRYYKDPTTALCTSNNGQGFAVVATDSTGHATEMEAYIDLTTGPIPVGSTAALSFWTHYDRSFAGSPYAANYGLTEIPDEVHRVVMDPLGFPVDFNVGPLHTVVRKAVAGTSVTITQADVSAASGLPGTITFVGLDIYNVRSNDATFHLMIPSVPISTVTMGAARDFITINFSLALACDVEVMIFFRTSDVNKWVEIGRGGKSVRAYYSWSETLHDFGGPPGVGNYAYHIGSATWSKFFINGDLITGMPILWSRANLVDDYTLAPGYVKGFENSNLVSFDTDASVYQYTLCIVPSWAPLDPGDNLLIHYTYTPYQGLSSEGGKSVVGTAVPRLKTLLHGRVEASTDYYAMQSGAASVYSGVDTFTGRPANFNSHTVPTARFQEYNDTALVKSSASPGVVSLVEESVDKHRVNAAAVLRLPFPINPAMFDGSTSYHIGVMDFDLDPARFGANAGYWSYAPAYNPNYDITASFRNSQFHNALAPLALRGQPLDRDVSKLLTPSNIQVQLGSSAGIGLNTNGNDIYVPASAVGALSFDPAMRCTEILKRLNVESNAAEFFRLLLRFYRMDGRELSTSNSPAKYFTQNNDTRWTSPIDLSSGAAKHDQQASAHPGTAIFSYITDYTSGDLSSKIGVGASIPVSTIISALSGNIYPPISIIETAHVLNASSVGFSTTYYANYAVDVIRLPLVSGAYHLPNAYGSSQVNEYGGSCGETSLVGRIIEYPPSWSPTTVSDVESFYVASEDAHGAGRGLYYGSTTDRFNLPVFVPGSGTSLSKLSAALGVFPESGSAAPSVFPYMPMEPVFAETNQMYYQKDHGGPMAYVCLGLLVSASSTDHMNQLVLNISGGPTGGANMNNLSASSSYNPSDLHGTAIDAFWPKGRPILKSKK